MRASACSSIAAGSWPTAGMQTCTGMRVQVFVSMMQSAVFTVSHLKRSGENARATPCISHLTHSLHMCCHALLHAHTACEAHLPRGAPLPPHLEVGEVGEVEEVVEVGEVGEEELHELLARVGGVGGGGHLHQNGVIPDVPGNFVQGHAASKCCEPLPTFRMMCSCSAELLYAIAGHGLRP